MLMVEHNLSVVADLSDRITVLARGEVLAEGTYAEVSQEPAGDRGLYGRPAMAEVADSRVPRPARLVWREPRPARHDVRRAAPARW